MDTLPWHAGRPGIAPLSEVARYATDLKSMTAAGLLHDGVQVVRARPAQRAAAIVDNGRDAAGIEED